MSDKPTEPATAAKVFMVEHLDDELGPWSALEYKTIAEESHKAGAKFCLSSVPKTLKLPENLQNLGTLIGVDPRSVEEIYGSTEKEKKRVCLLDPKGIKDLEPEDGDNFDVFLFGGILGKTSANCPKIGETD
jgi:ribosome biogenesis SPOUT family RNA methylase Rps3